MQLLPTLLIWECFYKFLIFALKKKLIRFFFRHEMSNRQLIYGLFPPFFLYTKTYHYQYFNAWKLLFCIICRPSMTLLNFQYTTLIIHIVRGQFCPYEFLYYNQLFLCPNHFPAIKITINISTNPFLSFCVLFYFVLHRMALRKTRTEIMTA